MIRRLDNIRSFALVTGLVVTSVAMSTLVACGEPNISQEQASPYVDKWSATVEGTLREMAVAPAGKKNFEERLTQAAAAQEAQVQRDEPPYDVFVDDAYKELGYEFQLVERTGLKERGKAVWTTLQAVEEHALDATDYALSDIESKLVELDEANGRFEKLETFETSEAEKTEAVGWLTAQPVSAFELTEATYPELTKTVLESDSGQRMKARLTDYETVSAEIAALEAGIEHLLVRNLARYSRQMKHFRTRDVFVHPRNFDRWTNPNIEGRRPDKAQAAWHARTAWRTAAAMTRSIADKKQVEILHGRIRDTLEETLTGDAEAALAAIDPSQPQYDGLKKEYLRYKKIAGAGGWQEVPVTRGLRPGREHEVVEKLKQRLQVEGYYPEDAPIDKSYDDKLVAAVEAYQKTHQMQVSGKPHHMFWSSLNIPAQRRMEQVALNMERWRRSNIKHSDPTYVYVNIPDFTAEVWKDQERKMRFRIVVGNNDLAPKEKRKKAKEERDESFKKHPNRTPTLSAYIDRVIYNPYWNVTERIRDEEILPEVRASVEAGYKAKVKGLLGVATAEPAQKKEEGQHQEATLTGSAANSASPQVDSEAVGSDLADSDLADSDLADSDLSGAEQPESDRSGTVSPLLPAAESAPAKPARSAESYWSKNADGQLVFDVEGLKALAGSSGSTGSGPVEGEAAPSAISAKFPYINPATGVVNVNSTKPDHIPAWYDANAYEVMFPGKKWEYVRMKQGDDNALGKVKVIFPNMHDVYLHDTPHKALFSRDIRAFSHGCMRMHEPLTFAEYLLEQDGKLDEYNVDRILSEGTYEPIFLDKQVPVHIDYVTVRVDENGRANFLADIYDYDKFGDDG
jgi:murein L,D-transpeptidase YcbB/YkuD